MINGIYNEIGFRVLLQFKLLRLLIRIISRIIFVHNQMDKVDTHRGLLTEASDAVEPSVYEPLEKP